MARHLLYAVLVIINCTSLLRTLMIHRLSWYRPWCQKSFSVKAFINKPGTHPGHLFSKRGVAWRYGWNHPALMCVWCPPTWPDTNVAEDGSVKSISAAAVRLLTPVNTSTLPLTVLSFYCSRHCKHEMRSHHARPMRPSKRVSKPTPRW